MLLLLTGWLMIKWKVLLRLEVINSFEKVTGVKLNYKIVDRREGDITKVWANPDFSNEVLGWKAEKGIDEMNLSAWKWELACKENA